MKKRLSILIIFIILLSLILLVGCLGPMANNHPGTTIEWETDGQEFFQFYTNNWRNYDKYFTHVFESATIPMDPVQIQVKKLSGEANCGFGMVFCYQNETNFLCLLVDTTSCFGVWQMHGGVWNKIKGWTYDEDLISGPNQVNILYVSRTGDEFSVYFNDNFDSPNFQFTNSDFITGKYGFYAQVGKSYEENFPYIPLDLRFKKDYPAANSLSVEPQNILVHSAPIGVGGPTLNHQ